MPYDLTVTKTKKSDIDSKEVRYGWCTNDFIEINGIQMAEELLYTEVSDGSNTVITSIGNGEIDNQLDVDWFSYTPHDDICVDVNIEGSGCFVIYDEGTLINGSDHCTYNMKSGKTYYIGVYCPDGTYGEIEGNAYYELKIQSGGSYTNDGQNVHVVLYDSACGGDEYYADYAPRYYNETGNKFEYSTDFFEKYLSLFANKVVDFSISIRDLDYDLIPPENLNGVDEGIYLSSYDDIVSSGQLWYVKNIIINKIVGIYDNIYEAYENLPNENKPISVPQIYIGTPHFRGWNISGDTDKYVVGYDDLIRDIYDCVSSYIPEEYIAGLYYGRENPDEYDQTALYSKMMLNTSNMIHEKNKKMIWMPFTNGSSAKLNNIGEIVNTKRGYNNKPLCDIVVIQPGYFYYEIDDGGNDEYSYQDFMDDVHDSVKNGYITVGGNLAGGCCYGDTEISYQIEYDASIYTGRAKMNDGNIVTKSTSTDKRYRLAVTIDKFKDLIYNTNYSFGIYAGGPNEQGYNMTNVENNLNKHSNRNHFVFLGDEYIDGHQKTYKEMAEYILTENMSEDCYLRSSANVYDTKIIYDITKGLMSNYWSFQSIKGFNEAYSELKFKNNKIVY